MSAHEVLWLVATLCVVLLVAFTRPHLVPSVATRLSAAAGWGAGIRSETAVA